MTTSAPDDDAVARALVVELAKKTGVCWVRHDGRTHPVWHVWVNDALAVVSGGTEQPLPDLGHGDRVEVLMRSKDTGARLLTWVAEVLVVLPGTEAWRTATAALVAARLNVPDLASAADGWAAGSVVRRFVPTGEYVETPG